MPRDAAAYAAAIKRRLDAVPAQVKAEIRKAQNENADEMVALAQRLAPARTGALRASIRKEPGKTELNTLVVAGDKEAFYARFVEFGTRASSPGEVQAFVAKQTFGGEQAQNRRRKARRTHPGTTAQPFFFPAYRALKKRMKGRASRAARKGIKAAVAGSSTTSQPGAEPGA